MRAVHGSDRQRLGFLGGGIALLLGGAALFNWAIDPYGLFGPVAGVKAGLGHTPNFPLLSVIEIDRLPEEVVRSASVVLVGDSRAHQLTAGRVERADGRCILNLAIPGGTFDEMLSLLELERPRLGGVRTMLVGAPLERFAEPATPDLCREAAPVARSPLHYLLNGPLCLDSWAIFTARRGAASPPLASPRPAPGASADNAGRVRSYWQLMYRSFDAGRAESRLARLRKALAPFQARGAQVLFWAPPVQAEIRQFIVESHLGPAWERLSAELREMAPLTDLTAAEGLGSVRFTFRDPVHIREGRELLAELLREPPASPAGAK